MGYHGPHQPRYLWLCQQADEPGAVAPGGRFINRKLKRGKAFEASKMHGLLVVSLDANEQFCSDHRCCEDCLSREVTCKDAQGNEVKKTQYYHKQVYAQLSGPRLSVILDVEPMRPGEEECAAALRLLRRMRRPTDRRFFDRGGGGLLVYQRTVSQNGGRGTGLAGDRGAQAGTLRDLPGGDGLDPGQARRKWWNEARDPKSAGWRFGMCLRCASATRYTEPVRVVRVRETLDGANAAGQEVEDRARKEQNWIWVVAGDLDGYDGAAIRDFGHLRWKIENNAFGELTQHWHLTHCRPSQAGGGVGAVVDKDHRLHALPRLCHCAWQTFPIGQGDAAGVPQANLPLVALWLAHSVLQRLSQTEPPTRNPTRRPECRGRRRKMPTLP